MTPSLLATNGGYSSLKVAVDEERNRTNAAVSVRVTQTDEEIIIAESTCRVLGLENAPTGT